VHRELPFTARLTGADLAELENAQISILPADEFIVVQGVVDLAVLQPAEIWLLDFKTDRVEPDKLPDKVNAYRPQLQLYALALERIYCRPVTCLWLHFLSPGHTVTLQ
jgi:ATP-dependent helicase/nuclease subunit A